MKKIEIGWFSFTCCEDSTIIFTELLNQHYEKWLKVFNFKHVRILKQQNIMGPFDISFMEGALSSERQIKKAEKIRELSQVVVAIGSCACMGMPAGQRNQFSDEQLNQIRFLLDRFDYSDEVQKLEDVIKVDHQVPGCPMNEKMFLDTVEKLIAEYKQDA